jgi:hypothetical protein
MMTIDQLKALIAAQIGRGPSFAACSAAIVEGAELAGARPGSGRAGITAATFALRRDSAARAGITVVGVEEALAALGRLHADDEVRLFHFRTTTNIFTVFTTDEAILGCIQLVRRPDRSRLWQILPLFRDRVGEVLTKLSDGELRATCIDYFISRADVVYALQTQHRDDATSEDILDDVAEAVLASGEGEYLDVLAGAGQLPERSSWNHLERTALRGAFLDAWERRFSEDIYEAINKA